jgi:20S proteasome alpha/beta subunit
MTIAIGILAPGGFVMAADREQSEGAFKSDQGKIAGTWKANPNQSCLMISGAGDGSYLDAITDELRHWFKEDKSTELETVKNEMARKNSEFYQEKVIPFSYYPEFERPDYEIILGCSMSASFPAIWSTHKLALNQHQMFAAVGLGATTAKALLAKLYYPMISLDVAVSLAAYLIFQVKRSVNNVGLETDIVEVRNHYPMFYDRDEVLDMERHFRLYGRIERDALYYCLGGNIAEHESVFVTWKKNQGRQRELRKFFEKLNAARTKKWQPKPKS